jgi:cation diffusion facilitator family transporter
MPDHSHDHDHGHSHDHASLSRDRIVQTSELGIRAVRASLVCLGLTAVIQAAACAFTGSVALLADTVHNFGDAATALPLWAAFHLVRRRPTARFPYGFGRFEDAAGIAVLLLMAASAATAAYEAAMRLLHPEPVDHLGAVAAAALIGAAGNEWVARLRIRAGRAIGSAALEADGLHARTDALTSLAVLAGAIGVRIGIPLADPIVGLLISLAILRILWRAGQPVLLRAFDGIDPRVVQAIERAAASVPGVAACSRVRARWSGHQLFADLILVRSNDISSPVADGLDARVQNALRSEIPELTDAVIVWESSRR